MKNISEKDLEIVRKRTDIKKEDGNRAVYWIPRNEVSKHAEEDEIREDVACILGKKLAKNKWDYMLDEIVSTVSKENRNRDIFLVSISIVKKDF